MKITVSCPVHSKDVVNVSNIGNYPRLPGLLLDIVLYPIESVRLFRWIWRHRYPWCEQIVAEDN